MLRKYVLLTVLALAPVIGGGAYFMTDLQHQISDLQSSVFELGVQNEYLALLAVDDDVRLATLETPHDWIDSEIVWRVQNELGCGSAFPVLCEPTEAGQYRVLFLTAAHVSHYEYILNVPPERQEEFDALDKSFTFSNPFGGDITGGEPFAVCPDRDAGLIEAFSSTPVPVRVTRAVVPEFGTSLVMSGYPGCYGLWASEGLACEPGIASFNGYGGCSGGPVALEDGTVVGILVAGLHNGWETIQFASFYVTIESIEEWLNAAVK